MQGQANGQCGTTEQRCGGCCIHAELAQCRDNDHREQQAVAHIAQEGDQGFIQLGLGHGLLGETNDQLRDPATDEEDRHGRHDGLDQWNNERPQRHGIAQQFVD